MLSQKPLKIIYQNDDYWFPQVAPQLNASYDETTLTFDNEIGKGDFFKVDIEPGLRVRRIEVQDPIGLPVAEAAQDDAFRLQ